jgi:zinc/manganese transport system permease protein
VLNLVAGFQVLGTLMAVGVMMLPAVAARCWARTLPGILLLAALMGGLRLAGVKPLLGGESSRRARHRADRQRAVFISVFLARAAGCWSAGAN